MEIAGRRGPGNAAQLRLCNAMGTRCFPLLLLIAVVGCGPGPGPFRPACGGPMVTQGNPTLVLTGAPVSVRLGFEDFANCQMPTAIEASVLSPTNQTVPSTAMLQNGQGTVTFT